MLALQVADTGFGERDRVAFTYLLPVPADHAKEVLAEIGRTGFDAVLVACPSEPAFLDALVAGWSALEGRSLDRPLLAPFASGDPASAAAFIDRVPERMRARFAGRVLVWLAPGARGSEAEWRDRVKGAFLVADRSRGPGGWDRIYGWGAAWKGPLDLGVASVGPGSTDPPRNREEGAFYERAWTGALRLEARMIAVETWNDPGTGISETSERGRKYLEITRRFLRHYHVNEKVPPPKGKYTGAARVYYHAIHAPHEQGLAPLRRSDAAFDHVLLRGLQMLSTRELPGQTRRALAFDVDDSFAWFEAKPCRLEVEYFDVGEGVFQVDYDSGDRRLGPVERAQKRAGEVALTGSGEWKVAVFPLPDARFGNQLGDGADLRISIEGRGLAVKRVVLLSP